MREEMPYLDCELSIADVSERLKIPKYHITQIINEKLNKNFYMFINEYRINEVKRKISDERYKEHSIIRIAYDSGFNTKSTFNTIFKKFTNLTPTEYRRTYGQKSELM